MNTLRKNLVIALTAAGLFGPPGIILLDGEGKEIADSRVIGFQNAEKFLASLQRLQR